MTGRFEHFDARPPRADFGGSVSRFIDWYDANGPFAATNSDPDPTPAATG